MKASQTHTVISTKLIQYEKVNVNVNFVSDNDEIKRHSQW